MPVETPKRRYVRVADITVRNPKEAAIATSIRANQELISGWSSCWIDASSEEC